MTVEKFWNQAFLAALVRLPAEEAKAEADRATELCLEHWRTSDKRLVAAGIIRWKDKEMSGSTT